MEVFLNPFEELQAFLFAGGNVLLVIMFVTFVMWAFILERFFYFGFARGGAVKKAERSWQARSDDHYSWYAKMVRLKLISEVSLESRSNIGIIKGLVAGSPRLGLLGTVTGMVEVFDILAVTGSSNARLMAGGITKATIPTMAGLVAALSGILALNFIERWQRGAVAETADRLDAED